MRKVLVEGLKQYKNKMFSRGPEHTDQVIMKSLAKHEQAWLGDKTDFEELFDELESVKNVLSELQKQNQLLLNDCQSIKKQTTKKSFW
ncbi:hypothetical protein JCM19233_1919 [Vibrio astriarenae]|nr:hypothetical protein JCM19233_1919 [Vibrio sp. C7]